LRLGPSLILVSSVLASACKTQVPNKEKRADESQPSQGANHGLLSDGPFEGAITLHLSGGGEQGDAIYHVKDQRVRLDLPGDAGPGAFVFDTKKNTGAILGRDGKLVASLGSAPAAARSGTPPVIERTGKTDSIAGYTCELWKVREGATSRDACVVDNVSWASGSSQLASWLPSGVFPLRVIERDRTGTETSRLEVVRIERKSEANTLFTTPAP
jgi:Domain of unknown function (DUF4412)